MRIPPALHHRRFVYLWAGLAISVAGSQMQTWTLLWHIRTLTDQPIALGGIGLARILPVLVFSLVGGALADSLNRRKLMLITQTSMSLLALVLGLLTLSQEINLWLIYLVTALQAVAASFDLPARQALVPNLVPARDLPSAFSMNSIAFQAGAIIGPALSGLLIAIGSLDNVYFINAFTYLAVIIALLAMGNVPQKALPGHPGQPRVSWRSINEGVQFIRNSRVILPTMILDFFATFFSSANTLLPIITRDVLHAGPVAYGWLSAAQSIGAVTAALIISQLDGIRRQGPIFIGAIVVFGLATVAFGFSNSVVLAMLALVFIGAADSVSTIIRNTIRQLQTPDELRGRMTGVNQMFFMGGPQLGEVEAGVVAQFFGAPFAIISGGLGCVLAAGWVVKRWPHLLHYNGDEAVLAGGPGSRGPGSDSPPGGGTPATELEGLEPAAPRPASNPTS
jgi:MFS family permease